MTFSQRSSLGSNQQRQSTKCSGQHFPLGRGFVRSCQDIPKISAAGSSSVPMFSRPARVHIFHQHIAISNKATFFRLSSCVIGVGGKRLVILALRFLAWCWILGTECGSKPGLGPKDQRRHRGHVDAQSWFILVHPLGGELQILWKEEVEQGP